MAFEPNAHSISSIGEQVCLLGNVVITAIDMQAYTPRHSAWLPYEILAIFSGVIGISIGERYAAVVDGIAIPRSAIYAQTQILHDCDLGLH